ncbi:MAG: hypothetical protein R3324_14695, partial [Halobacteriales archaeon]|nr:hypothetical protein [Halobacteriales archaeon]
RPASGPPCDGDPSMPTGEGTTGPNPAISAGSWRGTVVSEFHNYWRTSTARRGRFRRKSADPAGLSAFLNPL